jgi:hypothetical protein
MATGRRNGVGDGVGGGVGNGVGAEVNTTGCGVGAIVGHCVLLLYALPSTQVSSSVTQPTSSWHHLQDVDKHDSHVRKRKQFCMGDGVGAGVGAGVGIGVGAGVGDGVGDGVGCGVGGGMGDAVADEHEVATNGVTAGHDNEHNPCTRLLALTTHQLHNTLLSKVILHSLQLDFDGQPLGVGNGVGSGVGGGEGDGVGRAVVAGGVGNGVGGGVGLLVGHCPPASQA